MLFCFTIILHWVDYLERGPPVTFGSVPLTFKELTVFWGSGQTINGTQQTESLWNGSARLLRDRSRLSFPIQKEDTDDGSDDDDDEKARLIHHPWFKYTDLHAPAILTYVNELNPGASMDRPHGNCEQCACLGAGGCPGWQF
jgi:hypothetical protein